MKKSLMFLLTCCLAVSATVAVTACDSDSDDKPTYTVELPEMPSAPSEGLTYELTEDGTGYVMVNASGCTDKNIRVADTWEGLPVVRIGDYAFAAMGMNLPISITFGENVTSIGNDLFGSLYSIAAFYVPETNTAFSAIDGSLYTKNGEVLIKYAVGKTDESFSVPAGVTEIAEAAFNCSFSLSSLTLPEGLTTIGRWAFANCDRLTELSIPDTVVSLGELPLVGSEIANIVVGENNSVYKSVDGNLYSKDGTELLIYPSAKKATSFTVPESVTSIGDYAFYYCGNLETVVLPENLLSIGKEAFFQCEKLSSVVLPENLQSIGNSAFTYCNITSVVVPANVVDMGYGVFSACKHLTTATIESEYVGDNMFFDCDELVSVTIGQNVKRIGNFAFSRCEKLTAISYDGLLMDWAGIEKYDAWKDALSATKVVCIDGEADLE